MQRRPPRSIGGTKNSASPAATGSHGVGSAPREPRVAADAPTRKAVVPMRKYLAPSLAAFFASLNISLAADEKKPEGAAPLQPMHIDLQPSSKGLPEAKALDDKDAK